MDRTNNHNGFEVPIRDDLAKYNCGMDTWCFIHCFLHLLSGIFLFKTIFFRKGAGIVYCCVCSLRYILGREKVLKKIKNNFFQKTA